MTSNAKAFFILCFLLLLPNTSSGEEGLACQISKPLPVALAGQGKDPQYAIQYQSGGGENCRIYRVRNLPGHPPTSVTWKAANDVLLLHAQLPACPTNTVCPWMMSENIGRQSETGNSTLVYGKKGDEYSHSAQTFIATGATPGELPEYRTLLQGAIPGSQGKPTEIGIEVDSKVEGTGPYHLTYSLSLVEDKRPISPRAHLVLERAHQLGIWSPLAKKQQAEGLTVDWQGITERFYARPVEMAILMLSEDSPKVTVGLSAKVIRLTPVPLIVRSGPQRVAITTAPAYFPVQ